MSASRGSSLSLAGTSVDAVAACQRYRMPPQLFDTEELRVQQPGIRVATRRVRLLCRKLQPSQGNSLPLWSARIRFSEPGETRRGSISGLGEPHAGNKLVSPLVAQVPCVPPVESLLTPRGQGASSEAESPKPAHLQLLGDGLLRQGFSLAESLRLDSGLSALSPVPLPEDRPQAPPGALFLSNRLHIAWPIRPSARPRRLGP